MNPPPCFGTLLSLVGVEWLFSNLVFKEERTLEG